jgi:ATP-dependent Clp protease protease subunit
MRLQIPRATAVPAPPTHTPLPEPSVVTSLPDELANRLLSRRQVMVTGEVDDTLAALVCSQLILLDAEDHERPVTMFVNSPGGSVDAGFAIYDAMQAVRPDCVTVCLGLAASMGQFLVTAGAPGKRFATPHARILMHQPHGAVQGWAKDIEIQAEQFEYLRRRMAELTAAHTGQPVEQVLADADRDKWFTAQEAVEYGLVDAVLDHVSLPTA